MLRVFVFKLGDFGSFGFDSYMIFEIFFLELFNRNIICIVLSIDNIMFIYN